MILKDALRCVLNIMFWKKFAASKSLPLSLWFRFNSSYSTGGHNAEGIRVFAAWGVASVVEEIWRVAFWIEWPCLFIRMEMTWYLNSGESS